MTRSKRISSPPSVWSGSASVSPFRMSASGMPWRSRFIFEMDQTPAVVLLAEEGEVPSVAAVLLDVLLREDEHAARARAGVVDAHALVRLDEADHHPDDGSGRVELAALLAGRVGELADEVLVRRAEQVGELEVLVAEPVLGEVDDEVSELLVRDRGLADLAGEVDVLDHAFEGGVGLLQRREGLVEPVADVVVDLVEEVVPARLLRDEEGLGVEVRAVRPASRPGAWVRPLASSAGDDPLALVLELVGRALQEQHPEDVFLELGGIHLPAEDVRRREEVAFQLGQGQLAHAFGVLSLSTTGIA